MSPSPTSTTPHRRRVAMASSPITMAPPLTPATPASARDQQNRTSTRTPTSPSQATRLASKAATPLDSSPLTIVTPVRRERQYGKTDSPFIPDIHPSPIPRPRRTPVRRHSAGVKAFAKMAMSSPVARLDDDLLDDKTYKAQKQAYADWRLAQIGSPGIRPEQVADEDSDDSEQVDQVQHDTNEQVEQEEQRGEGDDDSDTWSRRLKERKRKRGMNENAVVGKRVRVGGV